MRNFFQTSQESQNINLEQRHETEKEETEKNIIETIQDKWQTETQGERDIEQPENKR